MVSLPTIGHRSIGSMTDDLVQGMGTTVFGVRKSTPILVGFTFASETDVYFLTESPYGSEHHRNGWTFLSVPPAKRRGLLGLEGVMEVCICLFLCYILLVYFTTAIVSFLMLSFCMFPPSKKTLLRWQSSVVLFRQFLANAEETITVVSYRSHRSPTVL